MDGVLIKGYRIPVLLLIWLFCTSIMFWIEADSYTHDIFYRGDTGWFMSAGRFMMEGQIPYVEFADSKGLLLWIIYGLGYLICNYNYIGMFWIETIISAITFFYSYKTSILLLNNKRLALLSTILMAFPYYTTILHGRYMEFRCEDFCMMPIAWGLYYLEAAIEDKMVLERKIPGIMFGVGFVFCIMVKWSVGVMYMGLLCSWILLLLLNKRIKSISSLVLGIILFSTPFIGLFLFYGNFEAFILEYFVNTGKTVSLPINEMLRSYFTEEWPDILLNLRIISVIWILFAFLGCLLRDNNKNILPALSGFFILCVAVRHDLGYYTIVVAPFAIYACVMFVKWASMKFVLTPVRLTSFFIIWYVMNTVPNFILSKGMWYNSDRELFYKTEYILAQVYKPTIITPGNNGVTTGCLAGTKYWLPQLGETDEMYMSRIEDVKRKHADFVFGNYEDVIDSTFYEKYILTDAKGVSVSFWGLKGLNYPPDDFHISDWDVLIKRKIVYM